MINTKPKCLIVYATDALSRAGGVQKITCALATAMTDKGWDIVIVTEGPSDAPPFYPLPASVRVIRAVPKALFIFGKTIRKRLAKMFYPALVRREKPDVIVCTSWNDLERLPAGPPTVLMQHVPPRIALKKTKRPRVKKRYLNLLKRTACVQTLLPSFQREIQTFCPTVRTTCIGNPVEALPPHPTDAKPHPPTILSVGRLEPNKNQLLLIRAFDAVRRHIPDARLILCGAAKHKKYAALCHTEVTARHLTSAVTFLPETPDVTSLYHAADVYASPSLFEGWGLTVTEALSVGLPVVGLRTADGVNALVRNGETGLLTDNDPILFGEALIRLLNAPETCARMGRAGQAAVLAFAPDKIWGRWDTVLREIAFPKKEAERD